MKEKLVIIDTTSILFSALYYIKDDENNYQLALDKANEWFESILINLNVDYYIAFTDDSSFRKSLINSYKSDRTTPKPKFLEVLKKDMSEKWNIISSKELESDDLTLIHYNYYKDDYDCIIACIDSDLKQQEGKFYNYRPKVLGEVNEVEIVSLEEASLNLWVSVLAGSHNGLKGLYRCGEESAKTYLSKFSIEQYPYAVLMAYIYGIDKTKFGTRFSVKGLGLLKGMNEYNINFKSSYLLRTVEECEVYGIKCNIVEPKKYNNEIFPEILTEL